MVKFTMHYVFKHLIIQIQEAKQKWAISIAHGGHQQNRLKKVKKSTKGEKQKNFYLFSIPEDIKLTSKLF